MYIYILFCFFQRALIVSGQGTTKHFSRGGAFINQFPSHLPGGCRKQRTWKQSHALLDAIYVETSRTYYILDIIAWNELAFYDCDTMFRYSFFRMYILTGLWNWRIILPHANFSCHIRESFFVI